MVHIGDPKVLVPQMREKIAARQGFWLTVTGESMAPTLRDMRDSVFIVPLERKPVKGDILLTQAGEHCLLHRVVKCRSDFLYYRGDAQKTCEGPFLTSDIIGIARQVRRKNKIFRVTPLYHFKSFIKKHILKILVFAKRLGRSVRHK
jgi:signal peptidase I